MRLAAVQQLEMLAGGEQPMWRCIPRWQSIKDMPDVLPSEDIKKLLEGQDTLAIVHCPCKRKYKQRQCDTPVEVCITVGRTARYNIDRGAGRQITTEEALEIIHMTDDYPLIHLALNYASITQLLCNCHWCCCGTLRPMFLQKFVLNR